MRYSVKIADRTFEVEIEDLNARPVLARVDGQPIELTPQGAPAQPVIAASEAVTALPRGTALHQMSGSSMLSPLPGTVTEVFVKPGEQVEAGKVLLVIEAMKMKNSIRSVRSGTVGAVLVSPGQSVAHGQPLVSFADAGEASWI
jgi:biotin carboxyl carrier protein